MTAPSHIAVPAPPGQRRRVIVSGAVGNIVEWFDWTIYAFFAVYFSEQFFPSSDPIASLMATFAVFAVGFVARPFGSVILGRVSDRRGRKAALALSILIMAVASLGIALSPTYSQIGRAAGVLLLILRLVQGLSLGGETAAVGAYLVESAPPGHRGRFGSVYPTTIMIGTVLGSSIGLLLTTVLTAEEMKDFGWRIPFAIGAAMGLVGYSVRRGSHEPLVGGVPPESEPIRSAIRHEGINSLIVFILVGAAGVSFFGLVAGFPELAKFYGVDADASFEANTLGLLIMAVAVPVLAALSDRIGRKPIMIFGAFGVALTAVPSLWLLSHQHVMASQLVIVIPEAALQSVLLVSLIERFPTRLRGTGFGAVWALSVAIVGGTAPLISTALESRGHLQLFGWYVAAWCLAAGVVAVLKRETAFSALPQG